MMPTRLARITGTVMAGYDGHRGWLYYLAVANDRRGTGTGHALVKAAEEWLARRGARVNCTADGCDVAAHDSGYESGVDLFPAD